MLLLMSEKKDGESGQESVKVVGENTKLTGAVCPRKLVFLGVRTKGNGWMYVPNIKSLSSEEKKKRKFKQIYVNKYGHTL